MNTLSDSGFHPHAPQGHPEGESFELLRYWHAINRHRVGIILFVVAVGIIASLYASSLRPVYRGTATILLDPVKKKSVTNSDMEVLCNCDPPPIVAVAPVAVLTRSIEVLDSVLTRNPNVLLAFRVSPLFQIPSCGWIAPQQIDFGHEYVL